MNRAPRLGTVNGFCVSRARLGRRAFTFDGTVKGLTISALKAGAKGGDTVRADFGGGARAYVIEAAPHDHRAGGFWAALAR